MYKYRAQTEGYKYIYNNFSKKILSFPKNYQLFHILLQIPAENPNISAFELVYNVFIFDKTVF